MPLKHYSWSKGELPLIESHSLAKHSILRHYVLDYIRILTSDPRRERLHLDIIDGFAGGGTYLKPSGEPHYGSPVILLRALDEGVRIVNETRRKPLLLTSKAYFIEKDRQTFQLLLKTLADVGLSTDERITSIYGGFSENLDKLIHDITKRKARKFRAIFVLDQYGYSDVTVRDLKKIFTLLPHAEVFMTIAIDWVLAYHPNPQSSAAELGRVLLSEPSERLVLQALLDGRLTDDQLRPETNSGRKARFVVQVFLRDLFTNLTNARFYTPFFLKSPASDRSYWFCHLANSNRAHDVVKARHWAEQNSFLHSGGAGLDMLGYDPKRPPQGIQTAFIFDRNALDIQHNSLRNDIPAQLRRIGVTRPLSFSDLYEQTCNDTPATKEHFAKAINELCTDGELEKCSAHHGRRDCMTAVADDDLISIPRQGNLFVDLGDKARTSA